MRSPFENSITHARSLDRQDELKAFREDFLLPVDTTGKPLIYLTGNSLGLQPRSVRSSVEEVLDDWAQLGVEAHFRARNSWMPYHELLTDSMSRIVGANPHEVVIMNSLTVNLHLMMASFYRPTRDRFGILIEADAFPSDQYAVASQIRWHGYDPDTAIHRLSPRDGESTLRSTDIAEYLDQHGSQIALVLLGGVNYYTGQFFQLDTIAAHARDLGCVVGYDLAHAAGNVPLFLHDWNVDFACWCTYKYLNAGPGSPAAIFVHERHAESFDGPRLTGWWGHDKQSRFQMPDTFKPTPGAEGWQLSNPSILAMAALKASLEIFDRCSAEIRWKKSCHLTSYMEHLLATRCPAVEIITPSDETHRGAQLSLRVPGGRKIFDWLSDHSVIADWREPDVVRVAPVPLYNTFEEVFTFVSLLEEAVSE